MRLGDVDNQEVDFVPVLFVELIEGGNLPPKGRSSVAAKDKDYGSALCGEVGEPNGVGVAEFRQREIRSRIANTQFSRPRMRPERFEGKRQKRHGSWEFRHETSKGFGRLPHDLVEHAAGEQPGQNYDTDSSEQCFLQDASLMFAQSPEQRFVT
jgi:hypothetical protein